jgi:hypothetical protein
MKIFSLKSFFLFIFLLLINNVLLAEKHLEVQKLYDLYSQDILTIDQLNSGLKKMNLNNQNMKSLISLRKDGVISEDDFIDGVKKIVADVSNPENEIKDDDNVIKTDSTKYEFQTEITMIHRYVGGDFKYGEIWKYNLELIDNKISKISLKDIKDINLVKFSKPKFKLLKENKFSIRSRIILIDSPADSIRFDFKGQFQDNKIIGETEITYTGSDAPGTVLLKANTK